MVHFTLVRFGIQVYLGIWARRSIEGLLLESLELSREFREPSLKLQVGLEVEDLTQAVFKFLSW